MTDELPPLWALDMAATLAHSQNYALAVQCNDGRFADSIIAHARTLAKYEKPPVDDDELKRRQDAREAAACVYSTPGARRSTFQGHNDHFCSVQSAYIALCREHKVDPIPVEEWGA